MKILLLLIILAPNLSFADPGGAGKAIPPPKEPLCKNPSVAKDCWKELCKLHMAIAPKIINGLSDAEVAKRKSTCDCIAANFAVQDLAYYNCRYTYGDKCLDTEFSQKDKNEVLWAIIKQEKIRLKCGGALADF